MIYETWNVKFDIDKLRQHLDKYVLPLESTHQSQAFGGWSVLSSTGSHKDGWHKGHMLYDKSVDPEAVRQSLEKLNIKRASEYNVPTEICHGYLQEVMKTISSYNLMPHRARIIQLAAGTSSVWHVDASPETYSVRLHIPIKTNSECFFETETERAHLPADGSAYFIHVNRLHRVINGGTENRYHIVIDVRDQDGITQHHRYSDHTQAKISS